VQRLDRCELRGVDADRARELEPAVGREIDRGERHVARGAGEHLGGAFERIRHGARIGRSRGEVAEQRELALAEDARRIVGIRADDAAGLAAIVRHRAVRERVVRLFGIAVALHDEQQRFVVGAFVRAHRGHRARLDLVPDLAPDDRCGLRERDRMLAAEDRAIRVVVEVDQLIAPPHEHRLTRGQDDAHACLERLRPRAARPERRARPIELPHQRAHLAPSGEQIVERHCRRR
jgi:hypothetical protein